MPSLVYADTNVFIRAWEGGHELTTALIDLLEIRHGNAPVFATSELTLAEILVHPLRDHDRRLRIRYERLLEPSDWLRVGEVDRTILLGAALLRSRYRLKLPDAIHAATALQLGCESILTGDTALAQNFSFGESPYPELATGEVQGLKMTLETVRDLTAALAS
ncbi:MAG: PIN domain-containing protein [Candidatus Devosia phytovorans]|uniref:Ribonuclease VapC n=1 Tax=Candidatus Devosia phytovorans TaxID=3121372 RepID=A0AAJ5VUI0_9HYPH|nr:PIN domain-containing protein [Devosia sp.]WEK05039.1 MAG: PIN domain-containing protein [Devosia sp.]